jgi:hypothetical protein
MKIHELGSAKSLDAMMKNCRLSGKNRVRSTVSRDGVLPQLPEL